jgi:hypothetical protein
VGLHIMERTRKQLHFPRSLIATKPWFNDKYR